MFDHAFEDFVTLLAVYNPTGIVPEYLYFTRDVPPEDRKRLALRSVLIATAILLAFIVLGQILLEALEISLPSFSIAGGLVLLVISLRAIFEGVHDDVAEEEKKAVTGGVRDLAVFPLATPLIAGPGGILVVVLLTDNNRFSVPEQAVTALMLLVVLLLTYLVLRAAESVQRALGITGISVVSRVSGLILAALAVETILDGIRETFLLAS